jgi:hypothetical protein
MDTGATLVKLPSTYLCSVFFVQVDILARGIVLVNLVSLP